jgi:hypothetical protein
MRYYTNINNSKCIEWGLNASQGALFDLLNQLSSWAKGVCVDGKVLYHISRNKVITELPLFYTKSDTVYRHFKVLEEKGLITYKKDDLKDLISLTKKGMEWNLQKNDNDQKVDEETFYQPLKVQQKEKKKEEDNVPSFDDFWNLYDKKVGKVKAEAKFNKLSSDVKERIMSTLPAFLKTITDKKYQPHPTTYLNNMRWEDEIEEPEESLEVRRRREKLIKENPWIAKDFDASKIKFKDTENWDYSTRVKFEKKYPNDYKRVMDEFRFLIQNKVI